MILFFYIFFIFPKVKVLYENISHQLDIFVIYDCVIIFQTFFQISVLLLLSCRSEEDLVKIISLKLSYSYHLEQRRKKKNNTLLCFVASHKDYDLLKQLNYSLSTKRTIQDYKLFHSRFIDHILRWKYFTVYKLFLWMKLLQHQTITTTPKKI